MYGQPRVKEIETDFLKCDESCPVKHKLVQDGGGTPRYLIYLNVLKRTLNERLKYDNSSKSY